MSGSKVHHLSTLLTAAQHCKHSLHFPTILLVLWLICCCHHHQCNAIKLFPVHEHDPANSFSKFVSYDGNLPAKFFSPAQQFDREDDDVTNALSDDQVSSLAISNQMVAEAFTEDECKEQKEKRAKPELLLPRRERRFSWDRWIHWFRPPSDRTSMGFMPVRGRKTTFIAARGKKIEQWGRQINGDADAWTQSQFQQPQALNRRRRKDEVLLGGTHRKATSQKYCCCFCWPRCSASEVGLCCCCC